MLETSSLVTATYLVANPWLLSRDREYSKSQVKQTMHSIYYGIF